MPVWACSHKIQLPDLTKFEITDSHSYNIQYNDQRAILVDLHFKDSEGTNPKKGSVLGLFLKPFTGGDLARLEEITNLSEEYNLTRREKFFNLIKNREPLLVALADGIYHKERNKFKFWRL